MPIRQKFEDLDMTKPITIIIRNGGFLTHTVVDLASLSELDTDYQSKLDVITDRINSGDKRLRFPLLHKLFTATMKLNQLNIFFIKQVITPCPNKDLSKIVLLVKTKYSTLLNTMLESLDELMEAGEINEGMYLQHVNLMKEMFDGQIFEAIEGLNSSSSVIITNNPVTVHFEEGSFRMETEG